MSEKTVVSTNTSTKTEVETKEDGVVVKTITTTTIEEFSDGGTSTRTSIKTITEGAQMQHIDPQTGKPSGQTYTISEAKANAKRKKVTTDKSWLDEALETHNSYRKTHRVGPLALSNDLCEVAQAWADKIADDDKMAHSQNGFGENIHWSSGDVPNGKSPVDHWYSEVKDYDYNKNADFQKGTGHFTQVVWKGSTELGIAKATGKKKGGTYVVAVYNPAGNLIGKLDDNVFKP